MIFTKSFHSDLGEIAFLTLFLPIRSAKSWFYRYVTGKLHSRVTTSARCFILEGGVFITWEIEICEKRFIMFFTENVFKSISPDEINVKKSFSPGETNVKHEFGGPWTNKFLISLGPTMVQKYHRSNELAKIFRSCLSTPQNGPIRTETKNHLKSTIVEKQFKYVFHRNFGEERSTNDFTFIFWWIFFQIDFHRISLNLSSKRFSPRYLLPMSV